MKTFIQKNLIAVFAVLLAVGTMSFKMAEKNAVSTTWFSVGTGGVIGAQMNPDICQGSATLCAVAFEDSDLVGGNPPITNAYDDPEEFIKGQRHKN